MDPVTIAFFVLMVALVVGVVVAMWRMRDRVARTPEELLEREAQAREADRRKTETLERQARFNIRR